MLLSTRNNYSFSDGYTCQIFLVIEVFQMLQKAKTHAMPLGNHVTQQKLTETTKNRSALTNTKFWHFQVHSSIFRFIWMSFRLIPVSFRLILVYSITILVHFVSFQCHSASFHHIPVYSGIFRSVPVFSNARKIGRYTDRY